MKKIILALLIAIAPFAKQSFAQTSNSSPIAKVLEAYLNLKNALVSNDVKKAQASGKTMLDEIAKVSMSKMSKEQNAVWMKYLKKLSYDATHISEVAELEHDREHFVTLSKNMYAVVKMFPSATPIYYQFCPMANNGKGAYWLSEQDKIHNPYYGDKMNGCPSTKDTIQVK